MNKLQMLIKQAVIEQTGVDPITAQARAYEIAEDVIREITNGAMEPYRQAFIGWMEEYVAHEVWATKYLSYIFNRKYGDATGYFLPDYDNIPFTHRSLLDLIAFEISELDVTDTEH